MVKPNDAPGGLPGHQVDMEVLQVVGSGGGARGEMLENLMVLVVNINKQLHLLHQVFQ
jgi:hypothetical protein